MKTIGLLDRSVALEELPTCHKSITYFQITESINHHKRFTRCQALDEGTNSEMKFLHVSG